jgi:probable O-glycosylation ligase (exosortase A-associated)
MLRALFVIAIIAYGCAKSVRGPFYALLFYLWIAYFRPEYWLWSDFFSQLSLSFLIGAFVIIAAVLSPSEKIRFGFGPLLIIAFVLQGLLATLVSPEFDYTWPWWRDFAKTAALSILLVSLTNDESRFRQVFLVISFALGLEAVKQGWLQLLLNPGAQNENDYATFGDNNGVAVGMLILTGIVISLARTANSRWERWIERFAAVGIVYRALSTYSRGGFLACGVMALNYLMRSKRKVAGLVAVVLLCGAILPVMPDAFWERMNTINSAREDLEDADASVRGRVHFWKIAWQMALDNPIFGVGLNGYNASYPKYNLTDEFVGNRSVHNSWLGVLSGNRFPGHGHLRVHCRLLPVVVRADPAPREAASRTRSSRQIRECTGRRDSGLLRWRHLRDLPLQRIDLALMALSMALDRIVRARIATFEPDSAPAPRQIPELAVAAMGGHVLSPAATARTVTRVPRV